MAIAPGSGRTAPCRKSNQKPLHFSGERHKLLKGKAVCKVSKLGTPMILCSCNVLSDREIQSALSSGGRPSVGGLFRSLGCEAKCGRCARSIAAAIENCGGGAESCAG